MLLRQGICPRGAYDAPHISELDLRGLLRGERKGRGKRKGGIKGNKGRKRKKDMKAGERKTLPE